MSLKCLQKWRQVIGPVMACCALLAAVMVPPETQAKSSRAAARAAAAASAADAGSAASAADAAASAASEPGEPVSTRVMTFRQLGHLFPLDLRGVDGQNSVLFNIRDDEVVNRAELFLNFTFSPALLPELSHLNVRLNGEVVATLPLPKDLAGTTVKRTIALNPLLLTTFNRLTLQLIGHYTLDCEDPLHTSLWANISNLSEIHLGVEPVSLANDLRILPSPFFDPKDPTPLRLPFVMAGRSSGVLEAAGIVSSWFGEMAGYRGVSFPVSASVPAQGHAVVLGLASTRLEGVTMPTVSGPTLAVASSPSDSRAKLLLVLGRDEAELKQAASALVLGGNAMSGPIAVVTSLREIQARKPFDAPRWVPSDRPVTLGELAKQGEELTAWGYTDMVIKLPVNFPPGLSSWRGATAPMDFKYRFTPRQYRDKSVLNINVDRNLVKAYSLSKNVSALSEAKELVQESSGIGDMMTVHEHLEVPAYLLPSATELQFHFSYDVSKQGPCKDVILDNQRGVIDPDSTLDLSQLHHFAAMPDLASFANKGFPFTRMADLSETTVVFAAEPRDAEVSAYLALLARFSSSTGFPAVRLKVQTGGDLSDLSGRDLLFIGSANGLPLLKQWESSLPVSLNAQSRRFDLSDPLGQISRWLEADPGRPGDPALSRISLQSGGADAFLMGFESPLTAGRSVVAVVANQPEAFDNLVDALLTPERVSRIHGSVVSVRQDQVDMLAQTVDYYVGSLGWIDGMRWFISRHPLLLVLMLMIGAFLLAVPTYVMLRRRARSRLQTDTGIVAEGH
jgi:hypothetical protein